MFSVYISEAQPILGNAKVCKPSGMPNLFEHFFAMLNNTSEAKPILGNAKVCKPSEEKTNLYLFEEQAIFKAEKSRVISLVIRKRLTGLPFYSRKELTVSSSRARARALRSLFFNVTNVTMSHKC